MIRTVAPVALAVALVLAGCAKKAEVSQASPTPAASVAAASAAVPSETPAALATSTSTSTATATASEEAASQAPTGAATSGPGSVVASYFILPENHPDVEHDVDYQVITGLVAPHLGPHGFPVVMPKGRRSNRPSGAITDVNADGEILWWSTASPHGVRLEKTITQTLPIINDAMFPDGHQGDEHGFLTAWYHGSFEATAGETVGMTLGSDDDSWVFIDGNLVVDNGGVKPIETVPYKVAQLSAGTHVIDLFYADRHTTNAALEFTPQFTVSPVAPPTFAPTRAPTVAPIAKQLRVHRRVRIYGIHFAVDRATIEPQSERVIAEIAQVMKENPSWRFRVEGHTDSDGGYQHNMALSQRRAQAVVNDLVTRYHIARSRLVPVGYGYSRPVAPNTTAANKALNRRVELVRL